MGWRRTVQPRGGQFHWRVHVSRAFPSRHPHDKWRSTTQPRILGGRSKWPGRRTGKLTASNSHRLSEPKVGRWEAGVEVGVGGRWRCVCVCWGGGRDRGGGCQASHWKRRVERVANRSLSATARERKATILYAWSVSFKHAIYTASMLRSGGKFKLAALTPTPPPTPSSRETRTTTQVSLAICMTQISLVRQ